MFALYTNTIQTVSFIPSASCYRKLVVYSRTAFVSFWNKECKVFNLLLEALIFFSMCTAVEYIAVTHKGLSFIEVVLAVDVRNRNAL